jgi:glycosyltransferase involved in cell wall biosynthesis
MSSASSDQAVNFVIEETKPGVAPIDGLKSQYGLSRVALLTGGGDKPYALGIAMALSACHIPIDFVGSDDLDVPELRSIPSLNFLNLRGDSANNAGLLRKVIRILVYYCRLIAYAATAKPKLFHILWNNKFPVFDRTLLMLFYRALGKRITFTVHNVNAGRRDNRDTFLNRLTLKIQYHLCHHLFVHTDQMKRELQASFGVVDAKISVIPFGINSTVPNTPLTCAEARTQLGLGSRNKVALFFGNIAPYKGCEYLLTAMAALVARDPQYRLVIAGRPKNCASYWEDLRQQVLSLRLSDYLVERIEYVPDEDTEIYFKAADILVLPYTHIYQSGVLFLGYNFGLPVIASDVGSLAEDVIVGRTGFVCRPRDPDALAKSIERYFSSDLYRQRESLRREIADFAAAKYSWERVADITRAVYESLTL